MASVSARDAMNSVVRKLAARSAAISDVRLRMREESAIAAAGAIVLTER
jgi:hypothetical protein